MRVNLPTLSPDDLEQPDASIMAQLVSLTVEATEAAEAPQPVRDVEYLLELDRGIVGEKERRALRDERLNACRRSFRNE